jgi:hypothetical protein
LQKHKQDVSEAYIFSNSSNQTDYGSIKKNMNFQLIINNALFVASFEGKVFDYGKAELHVKNKTTAEIDYRSPKPEPVVESLEAAIDPEPVETTN